MEQCFACSKKYQRSKMVHLKKLGVYLHKSCHKYTYEWQCEFCGDKYIVIMSELYVAWKGEPSHKDDKPICYKCLYKDYGAGI